VRLTHQLVGALVLGVVTWISIGRIAEAKNEAVVGSQVFALDESQPHPLAAFQIFGARLREMGQGGFADRLEALRRDGAVWVAPRLGRDHWAVFVRTLWVRRIYIRELALLDPVAHLNQVRPIEVPRAFQRAFGSVSLAGTLWHELAHRDGVLDESGTYAREIEWYEALRTSAWFEGLSDAERPAWEWALESAIASAEKARDRAAASRQDRAGPTPYPTPAAP
jgi:hypothetical protein